ncbi:hypothetical protein [Azospirillum picis]|uniref:DUF4351 domain-containing protein n=1 Tax=Azospirillum picis TaxID=488438 RepID=A0ABU0MK96_9PROT|nr:hypothetical protein [Azospirillum picis]MBP2299845.1 hypothetical protein [Azospirillum picis]MDQ0533641.1 hypothetical protein [Azospirillum picis]
MKLDITLRSLTGPDTPALIRMLAGAGVAGSLPTEFPDARDRRVDTLVRLEDGRILHLEWQARADEAMPRRMLWYWLLITEAHPDVPVEQLVVQVGGTAAVAGRLEAPGLSFAYRVVDSRSLDPAPLLASPAVEDNLLAILCGRDHLTPTVRAILARLAPLDERPRRDALTRLLILAGLRGVTRLLILAGLRGVTRLVVEEVRTMPMQVDVERDPYLADLIRQGRTEGRIEGKLEGEAAALLRLVERRFGPLPAHARDRIASADPRMVEEWLDRVLEAASLDELLADRPAN